MATGSLRVFAPKLAAQCTLRPAYPSLDSARTYPASSPCPMPWRNVFLRATGSADGPLHPNYAHALPIPAIANSQNPCIMRKPRGNF